jgi:hypothetical protein
VVVAKAKTTPERTRKEQKTPVEFNYIRKSSVEPLATRKALSLTLAVKSQSCLSRLPYSLAANR